MKKYAMILLNPSFNPYEHQACWVVNEIEHQILTVRNEQEALNKAKELADIGVGAIEVCGAFGEELARKMYDAADHRLTVGYVICPHDQEKALEKFWS